MLKGKRTFVFAAGVAVLGALETLDWTQVLSEQNAGIAVIGIGAGIAILRTFTSTGPGQSE